jgi:hypothetical protein
MTSCAICNHSGWDFGRLRSFVCFRDFDVVPRDSRRVWRQYCRHAAIEAIDVDQSLLRSVSGHSECDRGPVFPSACFCYFFRTLGMIILLAEARLIRRA